MNHGVQRRKAIVQYLKLSEQGTMWGITVNRKYCPQLKHDRDLQYLLKRGILVRTRVGTKFCKHTVLRLKESMVSLA